MKLSCNGCRILRRGCGENCVIRPCLEWIKSPESQANATLFLAKFYGRTGLLNLIAAAPQHLGPGVFKSLLYDACGRLVNPTSGSLGLFWTGEWARCEAAVNAVLTGSKIDGVAASHWRSSGTLDADHVLPPADIRHVAKEAHVDDVRDKTRLKKPAQVVRPKPRVGPVDLAALWKSNWVNENVKNEDTSSLSQDKLKPIEETGVNLELTLGLHFQSNSTKRRRY